MRREANLFDWKCCYTLMRLQRSFRSRVLWEDLMGNPKAKNTRLEIDGANVASSEGRAFARGRLLPIACVVGLIGAQAWMPIIGLLSDVYRASALSLGGLSALVLPYLSTCAISAAMFSLLRARGAQTSGIYGAFVGALLTCLGTAMLLLFDGLASNKMGLLFALVGFLLGFGNSLMVMTWSLVIGRLAGKALAGVAFRWSSLAVLSLLSPSRRGRTRCCCSLRQLSLSCLLSATGLLRRAGKRWSTSAQLADWGRRIAGSRFLSVCLACCSR